MATLLLLPFVECGNCRSGVFEERMRLAQAPQITPEHAAAIRAFAESDECYRCRGGRLSILQALWH